MAGSPTELAAPGMAYAEANWGRWIARCPRPRCYSALQLALWQPLYRCMDCGYSADVQWPEFAETVERLLLLRPDSFTRNWQPGETVIDLWAENMTHGIIDQLDDGPLRLALGD